jgi:formate C-acetyltransferase
MHSRIEKLREYILLKKHHLLRQEIRKAVLDDFTGSLSERKIPDFERATERLSWVLQHEIPVLLPDEKIVFTRTVRQIPEIFTPEEWSEIKSRHYIHELGRVCNISSDYGYTIAAGLEQRRKEIIESIALHKSANNEKGAAYLENVLTSIDEIEMLADRYASEALKTGRNEIHLLLTRVPRYGARTFLEALQFLRILHFVLWASGNYHNTLGRFDHYMWKYLKKDIEDKVLDYDSAFELLEEFFLSFNKDSDLYPGMQQGDNGQSMVLGGVDREGNDSFNLLSEMCLKASLELSLIDPKINLRINKNTKIEKYDLGTELTRKGLGFPQYSNDEIVIPGLVSKGYSLEDARDYVVAACWEFIIPGYGMDIPNIAALSFAKVVDNCIKKYLAGCVSFDLFMERVSFEIREELENMIAGLRNIYMEPAPFQSLLMKECIENAKDISNGCRYNNYGIHGTGISTAADSLAAVKKYVFDDHIFDAAEMIKAIETNFEENYDLWVKVRYHAPKMGNNDDYVDSIAVNLLDYFSQHLTGLTNERGGCFRPGSGSAMYYLWHAKEINASADGRKKGEPLSANFSPSLNTKMNGPLSIIQSFSKPDMRKIMNGGPLTLELHDTVFRNPESIRKVSSLVKAYMDRGGHQLQINAVNRDRLISAKKDPDKYRNLIVRVWGWSGYFVELDEQYQDHIIQRVELML